MRARVKRPNKIYVQHGISLAQSFSNFLWRNVTNSFSFHSYNKLLLEAMGSSSDWTMDKSPEIHPYSSCITITPICLSRPKTSNRERCCFQGTWEWYETHITIPDAYNKLPTILWGVCSSSLHQHKQRRLNLRVSCTKSCVLVE